jgi:cytochrome c peroxidase
MVLMKSRLMRTFACITLLATALVVADAHAESRPTAADVALKSPGPARLLRSIVRDPSAYDPKKTSVATDVLLGDLVFHSPLTLGPKAREIGLSCNGCHQNGSTNNALTLGDLSNKPGNVDLTTGFFRAGANNHAADFLSIPSLRGARYTAPYGYGAENASLSEEVDHHAVAAFGGAPLPRAQLIALVRYVQDLDFVPNANLDVHGRVTLRAGEPARRGETYFERPRAQFAGMSCASCHPASSMFRDGRSHRVGSGPSTQAGALDDAFDTPTLLGTAETAPYFHDGRFATLADVVAFFDQSYGLSLGTDEKRDLVAYVEAVGAVDVKTDARTVPQKLQDTFIYLELLLAGDAMDDRSVWSMALDACLTELSRQARPARAADRAIVDEAQLKALAQRVRSGATLSSMRAEVADLAKDLAKLAADYGP